MVSFQGAPDENIEHVEKMELRTNFHYLFSFRYEMKKTGSPRFPFLHIGRG